MKGGLGLREYKKSLRSRYKAERRKIRPLVKAEKDKMIIGNILALPEYARCENLLCYVPIHEEIDTRPLIETSLLAGKGVAVPCCGDKAGSMGFYLIESLNELAPGFRGVPEPVARPENEIGYFENSLCVLPGIVFDRYGYRIGYGGGYYDRFLARGFKGVTVGVCYSYCLLERLRHDEFDIPCDYVVTESGCEKAL